MLVNQFVFSAQGSVFEQSPAAVWAGSRPPYTNPTGGNRKILFPRFAPEWVGRRLWWAGKKKWKGASVEASEGVLIGEEITPESAHSPAQTPTQTHTYVFLGFGFCCCSLMLRQISSCPPPHHHHHYTNTHTQPPLPSNTSPFRPSRPPNPAQSASSWRRQSMLRTPLSVSAQGRGKGPSAGDCGKSDLWCPRCCWPLTFFTPSLFIFPFVSPSLWLACFLLSVTYLFNSLLPVNVVALWKWDHWRSIWRGTRDKKVLHSGTIRW